MNDVDDSPWITSALAELERVREDDPDARLAVESATGARAKLLFAINELLDDAQNERRRRFKQQHTLEDAQTALELLRASMREVSAPIIEVWRGVLCVPLVGILDIERRTDAEASLLARISTENARYVIIDVTGLSTLDETSGNWIVRLSRAVGLLGARCVLTGVGAELAEVLMRTHTDLGQLMTLGSVRDALAQYLRDKRSSKYVFPG